MNAQKRGVYIVLEGIDGTGKSTQAELLKKHFQRLKKKVIVTREPNNLKLRKMIMAADCPVETLFLFLADRSAQYQRVMQWTREGKVVISDRSYPSSWAYQYEAGGLKKYLPKDVMKKIDLMSRYGVSPNAMIVIDIPVKGAMHRLGNRTKEQERFEKEAFLKKVHKAYKSMAKEEKWDMVSGLGTENQVHERIILALQKRKLAVL